MSERKQQQADYLQIIGELERIIEERKNSGLKDSYVAKMHTEPENQLLKKIGEEAGELALALKGYGANQNHANRQEALAEAADLLFHVLVSLSRYDINLAEVCELLQGRMKPPHS